MGVLAAASARKLDKGGYSLQEHVAVACVSPDPVGLDLDLALKELLSKEVPVLAASVKSHETIQVESWIVAASLTSWKSLGENQYSV